MTTMKSRWTDSINTDCPLSEYPRPQLVRNDWLCLNGKYDYAVTPLDSAAPSEYEGKITVPFAIISAYIFCEKPSCMLAQ